MVKLTILLLTFIYSAANASVEKIDIEIELTDNDYRIVSGCAFIGEKSLRMFVFQFKSKEFISREKEVSDLKEHITLNTDTGEVKFLSAGLTQSKLDVFIDEKDFKKLFNYSKKLKIKLNPYLIEEEVLRNKYLLKLFSRGLELNNPSLNSGVDIYQAANPVITVSIKKEELKNHIEKCNSQQKQWLNKRKEDIGDLKQKAKNGDLEAQTDLAMHYFLGEWVLKDINQGMKWLTSAAKSGLPRAQYSLGVIFATDEFGTILDLKKAKIWIKKAHENGYPQAQETWNHYELWKY